MKYLILLTIVFSFTACSKDNETTSSFLDCQNFSDNYKIYDGENIECQFYFTLTEYNGNQYIELNSLCADLVRSHVINENCQDICENDPYDENSECGQYLSGRQIIEIILIEK